MLPGGTNSSDAARVTHHVWKIDEIVVLLG